MVEAPPHVFALGSTELEIPFTPDAAGFDSVRPFPKAVPTATGSPRPFESGTGIIIRAKGRVRHPRRNDKYDFANQQPLLKAIQKLTMTKLFICLDNICFNN
jgi:hypothetical protein